MHQGRVSKYKTRRISIWNAEDSDTTLGQGLWIGMLLLFLIFKLSKGFTTVYLI